MKNGGHIVAIYYRYYNIEWVLCNVIRGASDDDRRNKKRDGGHIFLE